MPRSCRPSERERVGLRLPGIPAVSTGQETGIRAGTVPVAMRRAEQSVPRSGDAPTMKSSSRFGIEVAGILRQRDSNHTVRVCPGAMATTDGLA